MQMDGPYTPQVYVASCLGLNPPILGKGKGKRAHAIRKKGEVTGYRVATADAF